MKQVTAILTGDWHLREDKPVCRTDDFWKAQWEKVDYIGQLSSFEKCPVIHSGDLFHHWKPSPYLLNTTIQHLPTDFWTIYGQHDLPQHSLELAEKCGINVLKAAGKVKVLSECSWGQEPKEGSMLWPDLDSLILVWHHLTYITAPFPGATGGQAQSILKKYPQFKLILTGDNHQSFHTGFKGRLLVNPGSLTRQDADQIDFQPSVYFWYAEDNTVERIYLPIQSGVVSREHIEERQERDSRIDAFISRLNTDWQITMSFEENLERFRKVNNIRESVMQIIYKAIEL